MLFRSPLREELSLVEKEKALNETVIRIKRNSLEESSRKAADIKELQEIIQEQKKLDFLHISL